jgi:hypothetical protein
MRTILAALALATLTACGGSSLKEAGEECVGSSECAAGLVCDLGQTPAVCASNTTADAIVVDAPPGEDAPDIDAPEVPIDGMEIDARIIDAAVIDAPEIDAPVDAAIDAPIDAEPDA